MKNIAAALAKFHELMPGIPKDADNPFFKSKYAPLETILPAIRGPLKEAGLVFTQIPTGLNKLKTVILDIATGESVEGEYEMTPAKNDPQGQGSVLTYMRRYALVAMLGLNTDEDDDGNQASDTAKMMTPKIVQHGGPHPVSQWEIDPERERRVSAATQPHPTPVIRKPVINNQSNARQ